MSLSITKSISFTDLRGIFTNLSGDEGFFMVRISLFSLSARVEILRTWTDVLPSVQILEAAAMDMNIF
jgi:hypothetical protein